MKSRFVRAAVAGLLVAVLALLSPTSASAHDPIVIDESQVTPELGPYLPDGTISWALYGSVLFNGDTRGFEFDLEPGDALYISLLIPNLEPEISLTDAELPVVELIGPNGEVSLLKAGDSRPVFNEPFSGTSYITLAEQRETAFGGRYRATISGIAAARFTISVGATETFGTPAERAIGRTLGAQASIAPVQAWYDTAPPPAVGVESPTSDAELAAAEATPDGLRPAEQTAVVVEEPSPTPQPVPTPTAVEVTDSEPAGSEPADSVDSPSGDLAATNSNRTSIYAAVAITIAAIAASLRFSRSRLFTDAVPKH